MSALACSATATATSLGDDVNAALDLHKSGKLEEALVAYQAVVKLVPPQLATTLHSNIGAIYSTLGQYESAGLAFGAAIETSPENAQAHFNLAVTLTSKLGQHAKALKHCSIAMRLNPSMHKAFHLMGNIMQGLGRPEQAVKYFEAAEEMAAGGRGATGDDLVKDKVENIFAALLVKSRIGDRFDVAVDGVDYSMQCLSERPLMFLAHNLLSPEECRHIVQAATPLMEASQVMGGKAEEMTMSSNGEANPGAYRTSENAWLPSRNDPVIRSLQLRLAGLFQVPIEKLEPKFEELQVVKYGTSGQFKFHHDSSAFNRRLFTALVYLNTLSRDQGGETYFPFAPASAASNARFDNITTEQSIEEAFLKGDGLKIVPTQGSAVIFANHRGPSMSLDTSAVHAGLPVISAELQGKLVCNYWIQN